jgi:molybdopterin converting factor small subunit
MLVTIRLFAGAAQIVGQAQVELEFDGQAVAQPATVSVGEIARQLSVQFPQLRSLVQTSRWAVDNEFVGLDFQTNAEHTLVMIPPVSGG